MDSPVSTSSTNNSAGSDMQLYRALERANLLQYYDKFMAQGGDDLQQLCEAEEGEFFEIMELVGMSSKPLHVRRLQKVLHEFMSNPELFQSAQASPNAAELPKQAAPEYNINASVANVVSMADSVNPSTAKQYPSFTGLSPYSRMTYSPKYNQTKTPAASNGENASLTEELIVNVRNAAMAIYQEMDMQAFPLPKKIPQEMVHILEMATDHPQREEEIRKWAPIYGRFDSKRKSEKPLSLHEVTVNEAACQLCLLEPNLLFMRDRLFPLSRQVVRESGYQYKHGHSSRSNRDMVRMQNEGEGPYSKRQKMAREGDPNTRTERMNEITHQLNIIKENQANLKDKIALAKVDENLQKVYDLQLELEKLTSQQLMLMTEQTDLIKRQRRSDRYYGAKTKQSDEDIRPQEDFNHSEASRQGEFQINPDSVANEGYAPATGGETYQVTTNNIEEPPRTESPKPDGARVSRRKGTPRSHQAFLKQALIDEGLRLAQVFNDPGEAVNNGGGDMPNQGDNYRVDEDVELRQVYGIQGAPQNNVSVADMNSEAVSKPLYMSPDMVNGSNGQTHMTTNLSERLAEQTMVEANNRDQGLMQQPTVSQQILEHV
ncbi:uncharacterized protein [Apostichopus japonicus]|uniref:uncharacterized protein isoform X3 n=1 Tax=Stichopus japonicus TaxID=307972 RepID=UPI003AB4EE2E